MARQTSKGTCAFCNGEFSKAGMTKHLDSCQQRAAIHAETRGRQKAQKTYAFHLVVEGRELPMYWMHLQVPVSTTLTTLDRFLRNTWLECCGHLSAFDIGGIQYSVDAGMHDDWGMGMDDKSMRVRIDRVLGPGQSCTYDYDFGSTTELKLKVISEYEMTGKGKDIQVLARNNPPALVCNVCGKPATSICSECIYDDQGYLCDDCAKNHKCGEEMLLPMVNSPRAGVCAYTG
jgi:hypothetical protein